MPDHNPRGHDRMKTSDGLAERDPRRDGTALPPGISRSTRAAERPLTPRQVRILAFVRDFASRNPHPPAIREITNGCGLSSTSVAFHNLRRLEAEGFLTRVPGSARSTVLTPRGRSALPAGPIAVAQDFPVAGAS